MGRRGLVQYDYVANKPERQVILRPIISRERIAARVSEIGQCISEDFAGEPVMLLGVLKGAAVFLA